ncbi:MAG: hypothetical protein R3E79_50985 [Caldilineaceae bacterium]
MNADQFQLYDLTIVVEAIEGHCTCTMTVGIASTCAGANFLYLTDMILPHALQAVIPPAGQTAPQPSCRLDGDRQPRRLPRSRLPVDYAYRPHRRTLRHDEVSPIPWEEVKGGE